MAKSLIRTANNLAKGGGNTMKVGRRAKLSLQRASLLTALSQQKILEQLIEDNLEPGVFEFFDWAEGEDILTPEEVRQRKLILELDPVDWVDRVERLQKMGPLERILRELASLLTGQK